MALNLKNPEVETLATEIAKLARETKTEAIRRALLERRDRLRAAVPRARTKPLLDYLERFVWPQVPPDVLGHAVTRAEREEILGYGPDGV